VYRRTAAIALCVVCLTLLAGAWSAPAPTPQPSLASKLIRVVNFNGFDDPKLTLPEALDALTKQFDVPFEINERAFAFENLKLEELLKTEVAQPTPMPAMKNVRLATVLRKLLNKVNVGSGATWMVCDDRIEITTRTFQSAEVWGAYNGPRLPLVNAALDKVPFEEAARDLAEQAEFNVLVDNRAAEKAKTPISARLRNTPLDTAVRLLADMADLRSVHLDNVLYVTTKENAAALEARIDKEKGIMPGETDDQGNRTRKGSGPAPVTTPPAGM
jgi:hypothetical protein